VLSSSALSRNESLRLNRALYRLLLNVFVSAYAWEHFSLSFGDEDSGWSEAEEEEEWLADGRALSKAQYHFWKRSLVSDNDKRELMATWKFLIEDVNSWLRTAYYPRHPDGA
jgi:hypothetical protein